MTYRSPKAKFFHSQLMSFLRHPSLDQQDILLNALNNLDDKSMCELSLHGHSHLIDVLHLPKAVLLDVSSASHISQLLFNKIIEKARTLGNQTLVFLLATPTLNGFTSMLDVLKSGNEAIVMAYFSEINHLISINAISLETYKQLLIVASKAGFTPLLEVLKSGHPLHLHIYFNELHKALLNGSISSLEYIYP